MLEKKPKTHEVWFHFQILLGTFTGLITTEFLLFTNTDGVWSRESPNEVSPFTEH